MALDLIIRNARLSSAGPENPPVDIGVRDGIIVAVEPGLAADGPEHDAGGKLVSPGLIESHFHLDKAMTGVFTCWGRAGAGTMPRTFH